MTHAVFKQVISITNFNLCARRCTLTYSSLTTLSSGIKLNCAIHSCFNFNFKFSHTKSRMSTTSKTKGLSLQQVTQTLISIAPLELSADWDNVGLLVEPSSPHLVTKLMLTNDLTQSVLSEAFENNCNMIISYHPPIFTAHKRLTQRDFKERLVVQCLENRVAIYSPHTCFDAANDGVNDWLINAFGKVTALSPITTLNDIVAVDTKLIDEADLLRCDGLKEANSAGRNFEGISVYHVARESAINVKPSALLPVGAGRIANLATSLTISEAVDRVKKYIGLSYLRLALGDGRSLESVIQTVACCAGSGSSVLRDCDADVYLTGEMSHHDVLHTTSQGRSVILCEHSNSERGFLRHLQEKLSSLLPGVVVVVSQTDADPLVVV